MDIFGIFNLAGGLALFLYGMKVLGDGLEKRAGGQLKRILEKLTSNPLRGVILGAAVTAVIQSSSATTVMVVGFVNSGIMKLEQSVGVILGANIGTTITAWILSLTGIQGESFFIQMLKPSSFSPILAIIGVAMLMFSKKNKRRDIGTILLGFAVLMFGMETMSSAVAPLADDPGFQSFLTYFSNPILGVLTGTLVTAAIQSSSASVGILQALTVTGGITFAAAIPIILGQNIGTCITAMLSSIGTSKDARRTALVHLFFNLTGKVIVVLLFYAANAIFNFGFMEMTVNTVDIAIVHTALNMISVALVLPFSNQLVRFSRLVIKEGKTADTLELLDVRLMATPSIAIDQARHVTYEMAERCQSMFTTAMDLVSKFDGKRADSVNAAESMMDRYEDSIGTYLVALSANAMTHADNREAQRLLHAIGDFERIGDHAVNMTESAQEMHDKGIAFSGEASSQLDTISDAVREVMELSIRSFVTMDVEMATKVEPLEDVVDYLRAEMKRDHIERLQAGECTIELGFVLSDILTDYERVADHCSNIAAYVIQTEQHTMATHQYMIALKDNSNSGFLEQYEAYMKKYHL